MGKKKAGLSKEREQKQNKQKEKKKGTTKARLAKGESKGTAIRAKMTLREAGKNEESEKREHIDEEYLRPCCINPSYCNFFLSCLDQAVNSKQARKQQQYHDQESIETARDTQQG